MFTKSVNTSIGCKHSCCFTKIKDELDDACPNIDKTKAADIYHGLFEVGKLLLYTEDGFTTMVKVIRNDLDADVPSE